MSFLAPLAPLAGSLIGNLAGPVLGGIGGLLGSKSGSVTAPQVDIPKISYAPPSFSGGGLTGTFSNNGYTVSPSVARTGSVGGLSRTFGNLANQYKNLAGTITPGFSAFRQAGLNTLENRRVQAIGNLRDNLARRRILGSSFAQDALSRANAEYAQNEANFQADAYMKELQASDQLIQQEYSAATDQFKTQLNEMNLEANLGAQLTQSAMTTMANVATAQAKLDLEGATTNAKLQAGAEAGAGKFWGGIGTQIGNGLGKTFSSLGSSIFGGGSAATPAFNLGSTSLGLGLY